MSKRDKGNPYIKDAETLLAERDAATASESEANGTAAVATEPQPAFQPEPPTVPVAKPEHPAVLKYVKAPSQVFYAVMGEGRDGAVDCLAVTKTRGQAEKALNLVGMAVKRHYDKVNLWKCRPVDVD